MAEVKADREDTKVTVVGAGPNGLAAAVAMARAGARVTIHETMDGIGGGVRTEELTLPGYLHDVCSAVHPMGAASPFFRQLPLADHGLEWVHPPILLAHPFDDGTAAVLMRSPAETADSLGSRDRARYLALVGPFVARWEDLLDQALAPLLRVPRHPLLMARFGRVALRSALGLASGWFQTERARSFLIGLAAHVLMPLDRSPTAAYGLMLAIAGHGVGWPFARGGSQSIANALASVLHGLGGHIQTRSPIESLDDLSTAQAVVLDLTPRQVLALGGDRLPVRYRAALARYRYSFGAFKVDWALSDPIPWKAPECREAGTVHLGAGGDEMARSSLAAWKGEEDHVPYVILSQPTLFDRSRSPKGRHVAWAYCHVPHASGRDMTEAIERQVERFAPGFRDTILARHTLDARGLERSNPNLVGGDVAGGLQDLRQLFFRPLPRLDPYATALPGLYLCSAATPPGAGVHGMCGYHAARSVLRGLGGVSIDR